MSLQPPLLFAPGDGDHWNLLNSVSTVKVGGKQTDGMMTVIETVARRGFGPPLHRHDIEDELFHVTEGALWVSCAGQKQVLESGGTAWLPRGLPHQFQAVGDGDTRFLQITTPAQFEDMVAALGVPLDSPRIGSPLDIDPGRVAQVCAAFQIEILGPPPPPLD